MGRRSCLAFAGFMCLAGCGYVGPIVPPSPQIPNPVTDLRVTERGDQLVISFSTPAHTTDNLGIYRFDSIELGLGVPPAPFDFERWSSSAEKFQVPAPPRTDKHEEPEPRELSKRLPVTDWVGKHVAVAVRTSVKQNGHYSQWSNRVVLDVVDPITPPVVTAKAEKQGYMLTWPTETPGGTFEIFRQGPHDKEPQDVGAAESSPWVDTKSQWDTPYSYTVVAKVGDAESLPSKPVNIISADIFAPDVPSSITALAGPDSVEVTWSRSPDSDLAGYYIYRSVDNGSFEKQGGLTTLPTYSDHNVQHGKTYRYMISAVDQKGNESEKTRVAEASF